MDALKEAALGALVVLVQRNYLLTSKAVSGGALLELCEMMSRASTTGAQHRLPFGDVVERGFTHPQLAEPPRWCLLHQLSVQLTQLHSSLFRRAHRGGDGGDGAVRGGRQCDPSQGAVRRCTGAGVRTVRGGDGKNVATPQTARGWAHPPRRTTADTSRSNLAATLSLVAAFLTLCPYPDAGGG